MITIVQAPQTITDTVHIFLMKDIKILKTSNWLSPFEEYGRALVIQGSDNGIERQ